MTQAILVEGRHRVRIHEPGGSVPPGFELATPTLEDAYLVFMRTPHGTGDIGDARRGGIAGVSGRPDQRSAGGGSARGGAAMSAGAQVASADARMSAEARMGAPGGGFGRFFEVFRQEFTHNLRRPLFWVLILLLGFMSFEPSTGHAQIGSGDARVGGTQGVDHVRSSRSRSS